MFSMEKEDGGDPGTPRLEDELLQLLPVSLLAPEAALHQQHLILRAPGEELLCLPSGAEVSPRLVAAACGTSCKVREVPHLILNHKL